MINAIRAKWTVYPLSSVDAYLPARRRPQGLVVIGVCLSVCLCALMGDVGHGQRAGLCPPRTQYSLYSSTQPNAARAFRNLCDPISIVTHICEFPLLIDQILRYSKKTTMFKLGQDQDLSNKTKTKAATYKTKTKTKNTRPRPPEVNKGTWRT